MPKKAHDALERQAKKKGLKGEAKDRYVYGALQNQKKGKGR
jgi:hypothetical protein